MNVSASGSGGDGARGQQHDRQFSSLVQVATLAVVTAGDVWLLGIEKYCSSGTAKNGCL